MVGGSCWGRAPVFKEMNFGVSYQELRRLEPGHRRQAGGVGRGRTPPGDKSEDGCYRSRDAAKNCVSANQLILVEAGDEAD